MKPGRPRYWRLVIAVAGVILTQSGIARGQPDPLGAYHRALDVVRTSLAAHGGLSRIQDAGGFRMTLEGTFDLTTRLQGRSPFRPEPTPIIEHINYDVTGQRVAYDVDWYNYHSSNQDLREVHDSSGRILFIDKRNRNGGWLPREAAADNRERLTRYLPQMLLGDALAHRRTLRHAGRERLAGRSVDLVTYATGAGDSLTIAIDANSHLVASVSTVIEMPLLGDTLMRWQWSGYEVLGESLRMPRHLRVILGDKVLKDVSVSVQLGADETAFTPPAGVDIGDPPDRIAPLAEFVPYGERPPEVEELVPNVFMVRDLRPGFNVLFVEFSDFVLAVDAPTGWYEMNQIPPMNWSYGDSIAALAKKFERAINETVPGKPLRYVVLTHHHSDHIGAVREFAEAGVSILAGKAAATVVRDALNTRATVTADTWRDEMVDADIDVIHGQRVIADDSMEVQLIELPDGNPKADNYLMVYLPRQKLLYVTAFIYPLPKPFFPPRESIPLSKYFVEWLDNSGLHADHVYNLHGTGRVEQWHLEAIRTIASGEPGGD